MNSGTCTTRGPRAPGSITNTMNSGMKENKLRDGSPVTYSNYDPRNQPQAAALPGGGTSWRSSTICRNGSPIRWSIPRGRRHKAGFAYDALDRMRVMGYQQNTGSQNSRTDTYDSAGPLLSSHFLEDGGGLPKSATPTMRMPTVNPSFTRPTSPSPIRDVSGRLTGVSDAQGNIWQANSWAGNKQPKLVQLGANIQLFNQYDVRGRLIASRATRTGGGTVLAHALSA